MHNSSVSYQEKNWGLITLNRWLPYLKKAPESVLEVGCGNGKLCKLLSDMQYDVTGLDIVPGLYDRDGYIFVKHDMTRGRMPFKDKTFDYCLSFDFLEHLPTKWIEEVIWDMFRVSYYVILVLPCFHEIRSSLKRQLHLTNKSAEWWIEKLNRLASNTEDKHITIHTNPGDGVEKLLFFGRG